MKAFLYILNTLSDWEIGYIIAELNSGRFFNKTKKRVELIKIADTIQPIKTMGGIEITPNERINDIEFNENDILILPGADTWFQDANKKVIELIPELLKKKIVVAAICGATLALAKTGILNTRKHTSNDKEFLKMSYPEYSGEHLYLNQPVVTDGNLITATGLAPLEFSYEVFKKIDVMQPETLEAWYQLNKTRDIKYFYALMDSLE